MPNSLTNTAVFWITPVTHLRFRVKWCADESYWLMSDLFESTFSEYTVDMQHDGFILLKDIISNSIRFSAWLNDYISVNLWDIITHDSLWYECVAWYSIFFVHVHSFIHISALFPALSKSKCRFLAVRWLQLTKSSGIPFHSIFIRDRRTLVLDQ